MVKDLPWSSMQGSLCIWSFVMAFRHYSSAANRAQHHIHIFGVPGCALSCLPPKQVRQNIRAAENFPEKHWEKAMNQNENTSWKCTSFQQQRQASPYTPLAGCRDFTSSQAEQTHRSPERAFGLTATGSLSLGSLCPPKLAVLSNLWSVHL